MGRATHTPERLPLDQVRAQSALLASQPVLGRAIAAVADAVAVLNSQRQVVFANRALLDLAGAGSIDELAGRRTGELFGCIHAHGLEEGCGTGAECRFCGAAQAVRETQASGAPASRECTIVGRTRDREVSHDLRVTTTPFDLDSETFVLMSLRDISAEKRKVALERIFFHDVLNTVSSLKIYLALLKNSKPAESGRLLGDLEAIADGLVEEIQSQKQLVNAENRTLQVTSSLISSRELVEELLSSFAHARAGGIVNLAADAETFAFVSDAAILRRVLGNMLRNALEAGSPGGPVTLGCSREGSSCSFWVHNPGTIPAETRRHIFRRYFSTKGRDRGLGTYGMKLLTEEYLKGRVTFTTDEPRGTRFTVTLPL